MQLLFHDETLLQYLPTEWDFNRHGKIELQGPMHPKFYLLRRGLEIFLVLELYPSFLSPEEWVLNPHGRIEILGPRCPQFCLLLSSH